MKTLLIGAAAFAAAVAAVPVAHAHSCAAPPTPCVCVGATTDAAFIGTVEQPVTPKDIPGRATVMIDQLLAGADLGTSLKVGSTFLVRMESGFINVDDIRPGTRILGYTNAYCIVGDDDIEETGCAPGDAEWNEDAFAKVIIGEGGVIDCGANPNQTFPEGGPQAPFTVSADIALGVMRDPMCPLTLNDFPVVEDFSCGGLCSVSAPGASPHASAGLFGLSLAGALLGWLRRGRRTKAARAQRSPDRTQTRGAGG